MTLLNSIPAEPQSCPNSSSVESLIVSSPVKSPVKCPFEELPEKWDKASKVRETVRAYTQKLPVPGKQKQATLSKTEDEVAEEIIELKKALNTAKHDLQIEKVRNRRYENSIGKHKRNQGEIQVDVKYVCVFEEKIKLKQ